MAGVDPSDVKAGVGTAASIGATVATAAAAGTALEVVPLLGPILHACAIALAAFAAWMTQLGKDTFSIKAPIAEAWLTLFRIHPAATMLNVDRAQNPTDGANLVRYLRIVSGEVPQGTKGNNGQLNNPHISTACDNPYQCAVDPDEPLTDPVVLARAGAGFAKWAALSEAPGNAGKLSVNDELPKLVPTQHRHPDDAKALLALIRNNPDPFKAIVQWEEYSKNANQFQAQVRAMRLLAGEDGPDPAPQTLTNVLGGDLTVHQPKPKAAPVKATTAQAAAAPHQDSTPSSMAGVWDQIRSNLTPGRIVAGAAAIALVGTVALVLNRKGQKP